MTLKEMAAKLRETADDLDGMQKQLAIPAMMCSLSEAFAKLTAALGDDVYIAIDPPTLHRHRGEKPHADEWSVYDGTKHFKGMTLGLAVSACLAAHGQADNDVEELQKELNGAAPELQPSF